MSTQDHTVLDPIKAALEGDNDDDWRHLTHEDVSELQDLFEFFAKQDPALQKGHRQDVNIQINEQTGDAILVQQEHRKAVATKPAISVKGLDKLFRKLGLLIPASEIRHFMSQRKAEISLSRYGSQNNNSQHNDSFTYEEFLLFYAQSSKHLSASAEAKQAFQLLDDDDDGFVPVRNVITFFSTLMEIDESTCCSMLIASRSRFPETNSRFEPRKHSLLQKHYSQDKMSDKEW